MTNEAIRDRFTITRRFFPHVTNYEADYHEETWTPVHRQVSFDVAQCALVVLDVWNLVSPIHKHMAAVTEERIGPVVKACRKAGLLVIHAPGPQVADKYPEHRFRPSPAEDWLFYRPWDGWPTREMLQRTGPYSEYAMWYEEDKAHYTEEQKYTKYFIHPAVAPEEGDLVIGDREELHALLKEREIFNLFYVGFASNGCMLERDYGVRWVGYLGYDITLLRDCTRATETAASLPTLRQTRSSVENLEFWISTTTSENFIKALENR